MVAFEPIWVYGMMSGAMSGAWRQLWVVVSDRESAGQRRPNQAPTPLKGPAIR